mmetsp:Transcript_3246/g.7653  ORF Transcript_3246/g.7653 Transcript_3246/m.7653 type:complete len:423 (-) Transcript_3246:187-1455(-)
MSTVSSALVTDIEFVAPASVGPCKHCGHYSVPDSGSDCASLGSLAASTRCSTAYASSESFLSEALVARDDHCLCCLRSGVHSAEDRLCEGSVSDATSGQFYGEPNQTLLFLDWDDTLFPTSWLVEGQDESEPEFNRWCSEKDQTEETRQGLQKWRDALKQFLWTACGVSDRVVIVTNSRSPWVQTCICRFVPEIQPLFKGCSAYGNLKLVHAEDAWLEAQGSKVVRRTSSKKSVETGCLAWLKFLFEDVDADSRPRAAASALPSEEEALTEGKLAAMRREAESFYARYPGQTWKNLLSFGDMPYEYNALWRLSEHAGAAPRERLHTKAFLLRDNPSLEELSLNLQLWRLLLPAVVQHDGNIGLDLRDIEDQLAAALQVLQMPQVGCLPSRNQGSGAKEEQDTSLESLLADVAVAVHDHVFQC